MRQKLLRMKNVEQVTGLHRSTIYRMEKKGKFPKRIHIGGYIVAWPESMIQEWIKQQIEKSNGGNK